MSVFLFCVRILRQIEKNLEITLQLRMHAYLSYNKVYIAMYWPIIIIIIRQLITRRNMSIKSLQGRRIVLYRPNNNYLKA